MQHQQINGKYGLFPANQWNMELCFFVHMLNIILYLFGLLSKECQNQCFCWRKSLEYVTSTSDRWSYQENHGEQDLLKILNKKPPKAENTMRSLPKYLKPDLNCLKQWCRKWFQGLHSRSFLQLVLQLFGFLSFLLHFFLPGRCESVGCCCPQ